MNKNRLSRPPMPKIVKQKDEVDLLCLELDKRQIQSQQTTMGRSHSTYSNTNYYSKVTTAGSFDDISEMKAKMMKERTFSEIGSRSSRVKMKPTVSYGFISSHNLY